MDSKEKEKLESLLVKLFGLRGSLLSEELKSRKLSSDEWAEFVSLLNKKNAEL